MADPNIEARRRFETLESNLLESLSELESIVGMSFHAPQQKEIHMNGINRDYEEYSALACAYGFEPSSDMILQYKRFSE